MQEERKQNKPLPLDLSIISQILLEHWTLELAENSLKQLDSYDDANFYLEARRKDGVDSSYNKYLMKLYNAVETELNSCQFLQALSTVLGLLVSGLSLEAVPVEVPEIVQLSFSEGSGDYILIPCNIASGTRKIIAVRLFKWISGNTLSRTPSAEPAVFAHAGLTLGNIYLLLKDLRQAALTREHMWDLAQFRRSWHLLNYLSHDKFTQTVISEVQRAYAEICTDEATSLLPLSVIMGDCNDANIIVSSETQVAGIIDWSDTILTWAVNDLAIAMAYSLMTPLGNTNALLVTGALFLGYIMKRPLEQLELELLPLLMATRLSISVMVGAYSIEMEPENEYLKFHAMPGRAALVSWWGREDYRITLGNYTRFFSNLQSIGLSLSSEEKVYLSSTRITSLVEQAQKLSVSE